MLIFILIFLIKIFNKISFKNFLLISDMMYFKFTHIITLISRKTKNIIKIMKCYFLKTNLIFDVFFNIDLMIKYSRFTKYIIFSIFFYLLLTISLSLIKIIIVFVTKIISVIFVLETILLISLIFLL